MSPRQFKPERGSNPFPANFPGTCGECGWEIEEGDMIRYDADDEIVHDECGP